MKNFLGFLAGLVVLAAFLGAYLATHRDRADSELVFAPPAIPATSPVVAAMTSGKPVARANSAYEKFLASSAPSDHLNRYYVDNFLKSPGFGMSRNWQGPANEPPPPSTILMTKQLDGLPVATAYNVAVPQLIGIARHNPPVVFVTSRHLPGGKFATRPLTDFEERALAELTAGRETVVDDNQTHPKMVGAIRAQEGCLQCHEGSKIGDVLGAFTYDLKVVPLAQTAAAK